MKRQHRWWFALVLVALVVSACGPQLTTPTPKVAQASKTPVVPPAGPTATKAPPTATPVPVDLAKLPVDPDDFHVLGSPDAPVTMVDFSEFQ